MKSKKHEIIFFNKKYTRLKKAWINFFGIVLSIISSQIIFNDFVICNKVNVFEFPLAGQGISQKLKCLTNCKFD